MIFCVRIVTKTKRLDNVLFSISTRTTMFSNLATLRNNILLVPQILGGKKESIDDINAGVKSFKTNKIFKSWVTHSSHSCSILALVSTCNEPSCYSCAPGNVHFLPLLASTDISCLVFITIELLTYNIINLLFFVFKHKLSISINM